MRERILQTYDYEWVDVTVRSRVECCGCGLVHKEEYKIIEGFSDGKHIIRQSITDNKATGNARRSMKAKKEGIFAKKKKKGKKK